MHEGDAVAERHAPATHDDSAPKAVQSAGAVHEGKQNEPVEVLTHVLVAGQVFWFVGLHAAVHAPPGNSGLGSPAQISPLAHPPAGQAFPRSALAPLPCAGQLAGGTQAPRPGQQV